MELLLGVITVGMRWFSLRRTGSPAVELKAMALVLQPSEAGGG